MVREREREGETERGMERREGGERKLLALGTYNLSVPRGAADRETGNDRQSALY